MIRLLGAITGSALALAALLVLVGIPQFKTPPSELEQVVVTLPLRAEPVDEVVPEQAGEVAPNRIEEVLAETEAMPTPISGPVADTILPEPDIAETAAAIPELPSLEEAPPEAPPLQPDSQQWYAFWSPFRSEIAASGFVTQLQRVTGLDYRVVKIKPGVYEVAFAYAEDGDIPNKLSQISAATGLDMPSN